MKVIKIVDNSEDSGREVKILKGMMKNQLKKRNLESKWRL